MVIGHSAQVRGTGGTRQAAPSRTPFKGLQAPLRWTSLCPPHIQTATPALGLQMQGLMSQSTVTLPLETKRGIARIWRLQRVVVVPAAVHRCRRRWQMHCRTWYSITFRCRRRRIHLHKSTHTRTSSYAHPSPSLPPSLPLPPSLSIFIHICTHTHTDLK